MTSRLVSIASAATLALLLLSADAWAQAQPPTTQDAAATQPTTRRWRRRAPRSFFVAPKGDNANDGTEAHPFATIQHAIDQAGGADTITIAPGTYHERLVFHSSGAMFRPMLTLQAAPGGTVTISADGLVGRAPTIDTNGHDYLRFVGLTIDSGFAGRGIYVVGSWQIRIEDCHIQNAFGPGIQVDKSGHVVIDHNEVEHACQRRLADGGYGSGGGEETISVKRSQWVEVTRNTIHDTGHEGIDIKEGSNNVLVKGNRLWNVERQALYTDAWDQPTSHIRFEDNIAHDCMFGLVAGSESGGLLSDVWFVNNLVYNCKGPGMITADWGGRQFAHHPVENVYFINNTVVGNKNGGSNGEWGGGMVFENPDIKGMVVRNNVLSDNGAGGEIRIIDDKLPQTFSVDHNLIDGVVPDRFRSLNLLAKPEFVNPREGIYRLKADSPGVAAGSPDLAPAEDLDGKKRDAAHPTVGAYAP